METCACIYLFISTFYEVYLHTSIMIIFAIHRSNLGMRGIRLSELIRRIF